MTVIFTVLGRIFDNDNRSHSIYKLLKILKTTDHFTKNNILNRKLKFPKGNIDITDLVLENTHEMDSRDIIEIKGLMVKAKMYWDRMKVVRNKLSSHDDTLNDNERFRIINDYNQKDMEDLIQILLDIDHIIQELSLNGRKPDLSFHSQWIARRAEQEIGSLLPSILAMVD